MNKELSISLKNGDQKAYNELFNMHYSALYNFVLKLSNDKSLAKDIVQQAFIKLWLNRQRIKPDLSIKNYLLKICKNEFLIHARKKKKERNFLDQIKLETAYEMFSSEKEDSSKIDKVKSIIDNLSPKCREAFVLSKFEKMKYASIAEKMGISVKTVENHISKAYSELRKNMQYFLIWFF